ncbi:LytR/AlgR family response regulator transcription factor [Flagellimonas aurea]|uniref:LytR/AlgR family response regulator transcription factor n=1 Tax=Flagellimonas aurea TaxID=2915619 RepID=UPI0035D114E3
MKCIIIDDEPLAIDVLMGYCQKVDFIKLEGTFTNPLEAITVIKERNIDLIFCDIEMPQISGIDFITSLDNGPMFIFTTAYSQYAVEGFELNAIDYLVKPIPYHRFIKAISRAKEALGHKNKGDVENGNVFPSHGNLPVAAARYIFVKAEYESIKINLDDIEYIQGLKDYLKIHINGSDKAILTLMSFREILDKLPAHQFLRVHKSYIVNISRIMSVQRNRIIINETRIPIGDSFKSVFFDALGL